MFKSKPFKYIIDKYNITLRYPSLTNNYIHIDIRKQRDPLSYSFQGKLNIITIEILKYALSKKFDSVSVDILRFQCRIDIIITNNIDKNNITKEIITCDKFVIYDNTATPDNNTASANEIYEKNHSNVDEKNNVTNEKDKTIGDIITVILKPHINKKIISKENIVLKETILEKQSFTDEIVVSNEIVVDKDMIIKKETIIKKTTAKEIICKESVLNETILKETIFKKIDYPNKNKNFSKDILFKNETDLKNTFVVKNGVIISKDTIISEENEKINKKLTSERWTSEEIQQFYDLLAIYGTDFAIVSHFMKTKNRRQVKLMYNRQEKYNSKLIESIVFCNKQNNNQNNNQ